MVGTMYVMTCCNMQHYIWTVLFAIKYRKPSQNRMGRTGTKTPGGVYSTEFSIVIHSSA